VVLFLSFNKGDGNGGAGVAEFFEADHDFVLAFDLDEFADEALEWAFDNGYGFAFGEVFEDEFDGFVGKIAHEAKALNLVVGNGDGFAEFADEGDGAVDKEYAAEFGWCDAYEDVAMDNGDDDFLDAVAPAAFHGLKGQVVFNAGFGKAVAHLFFGAGCGVEGVPVFVVGLHFRGRVVGDKDTNNR